VQPAPGLLRKEDSSARGLGLPLLRHDGARQGWRPSPHVKESMSPRPASARRWLAASLGLLSVLPLSSASDAMPEVLLTDGLNEIHAPRPGEIPEVGAALDAAAERLRTLFH
jgi:hypothetical protein